MLYSFISHHLWQISTIFFFVTTVVYCSKFLKRKYYIEWNGVEINLGFIKTGFGVDKDKSRRKFIVKTYRLEKENKTLKESNKVYLVLVVVMLIVGYLMGVNKREDKK